MKINEAESKFAKKLDDPIRDVLNELSYSLPRNYHPHIKLLKCKGPQRKMQCLSQQLVAKVWRTDRDSVRTGGGS